MPGDYSVDTLPTFPTELQGNSAEGHVIEQGMKGYGLHSAIERPGKSNGADAPGAFIQGNNPGNKAAAGSAMSSNSQFNPAEK